MRERGRRLGDTNGRAASGKLAAPARALAGRILPFAVLFLATQSVVRVTLAWRGGADYAESAVGLLTPFLLGGMFDIAVFTVFAIPIGLWWLVLPSRLKGGRLDRWATILGVAIFASCARSRRSRSTCSGLSSAPASISSPSTISSIRKRSSATSDSPTRSPSCS